MLISFWVVTQALVHGSLHFIFCLRLPKPCHKPSSKVKFARPCIISNLMTFPSLACDSSQIILLLWARFPVVRTTSSGFFVLCNRQILCSSWLNSIWVLVYSPFFGWSILCPSSHYFAYILLTKASSSKLAHIVCSTYIRHRIFHRIHNHTIISIYRFLSNMCVCDLPLTVCIFLNISL